MRDVGKHKLYIVTSGDLVNKVLALRILPIHLESLPLIYFTCSDQFNLLSVYTPKNLADCQL